MSFNSGNAIRALAVRAVPLIEQLRSGPIRVRLQRLGIVVLRQVMGRFPKLTGWLDSVGVRQRQMVTSPRPFIESITDTELTTETHESLSPGILVATLAYDADWVARARAAKALAKVSDEEAVESLINALRDASAEVAAAAIEALAGRKDPRVASALAGVLRNPDGYFNPVTQAAAVNGIVRRGVESDRELLFAAVHAMDAEVSIAVIAALGEHQPGAALDLVLPVLEDRMNYFLPVVRLVAATTLERAGLLSESTSTRLLAQENDGAVRNVLARAAARAS